MSAPPHMTALESGVENGVEWATVRAPLYGAVNGYARVPEGHPWHGLDYDDIEADAPGGLTYSTGGWIGFDTLHAWDAWPGSPFNTDPSDAYLTHWTPQMVADEARELARKVAEAVAS